MFKFFKYFTLFLFLSIIGGGGYLAYWGYDDFKEGQKFSRDSLRFPIIFTDRNNIEIHRIFGNENREWSDLNEIPEILKTTTILAEDKRFYYHFGIDPAGILRAMIINLKSGKIVQGASTLTQQIAKKGFLTNEKSIKRKLREMFIAMGIESKFSKNKILEMYLNTVPYGGRINGIEVAAKTYFKKTAKDLSEAECLILTMLPQDPVRLSQKTEIKNWLGSCAEETAPCNIFEQTYIPTRIEKILLELSNKEKWSKQKTLSVWEELKNTRLPRRHNWAYSDFQHFQFFVRDFLAKKGASFSSIKDGIIVKTSLDATLQQEISHYLRDKKGVEFIKKHNISNQAFIILDNNSRNPLVWIGSKYYWNKDISGQIDMLQSERQVGSSMKPFIYSAAIEKGYQPPTIFYDSTVSFRGDNHILRNADGHYLGGIRMTDALAKSRNIPAAKAVLLAGGEKTVKNYVDEIFGFEIKKRFKNHAFGWTISLGTAPIELNKLANGYATLATGERKEICPIISVKTFQGKDLGNFCNKKVLAKLPEVNRFFINDILSNENARPKAYGWRENLTIENFNIAAKTGTSSKRVNGDLFPVDDIVVGYSPNHTFLMWGGNTDGKHLKKWSVAVSSIGDEWKHIVQNFYEKNPETYAKFSVPQNLQRVHNEWATADYVPPSYDQLNRFVWYNREKGLNPMNSLSGEYFMK